MEDKQLICDCAAHALKQTDAFKDIIQSKESGESHVVIHYQSGTRIICTTMDSGFELLKDIINHVGG